MLHGSLETSGLKKNKKQPNPFCNYMVIKFYGIVFNVGKILLTSQSLKQLLHVLAKGRVFSWKGATVYTTVWKLPAETNNKHFLSST